MHAALAAIRFARDHNVPILGTCGGFQHIVLEYVRNALGVTDADHEETDPYASVLFISRLQCSLVGRKMTLSFAPDSLLARAYGATTAEEGYYCNFGVNPDFVSVLRSGPLKITASDAEGEVRAVELPDQPFYVGTLFIPQTRSTPENPHLLVSTFLRAAAADRTLAKRLEKTETKHLSGRRVRPADLDENVRLHADPRVVETLGSRNAQEVQELLYSHDNHWSTFGFGPWMWFSKSDGRFVGRAGLKRAVVGGRDEIEVGYVLVPEYWGRGLATEIALASIDIAFNQLRLPEIIAFTLPTNHRSRRVMEKCGFKFEREFVWKDWPHVLYRLNH